MSQSIDQLYLIYSEAFKALGGGRAQPEIEVKFYPYAGLINRIRIRSGRVYVRVSDIFTEAPERVHKALASVLVSKLLGRKPQKAQEAVYKAFASKPDIIRSTEIARKQRGHKKITSSRGDQYDLERLFRKLNREYFADELPAPVLSWSQRRTHRILGHHDSIHDTIVISKTLDAVDVPPWLVEFVMYHEMLHIKHVSRVIGGRRYQHTKAFRAEEKRFEHYERAQNWLDAFARRRRRIRVMAA